MSIVETRSSDQPEIAEQNRPARKSRVRFKVAITIVAGMAFILYILPAQLRPSYFLQDDSYFYLQIASNIVSGRGSTFHGISSTNGYHPLWMLFVAAGLFLAGGTRTVGLHYVFFLQALLAVMTGLSFRKLAGAVGIRHWLVGLAVLAAYLLGTAVYGSESHLNALLLTAGLFYLARSTENNHSSTWILAGVVMGLAVLARLDNVLVIGPVLLFFLLHPPLARTDQLVRRLIAFSVPAALIVLPYLGYNIFRYGHAVPISGAIKSTFPTFVADVNNLGKAGTITTLFALASLLLSFIVVKDTRQKMLLLGLSSGVLLHAVYVILFTDHYTFWPWYYVAGVLNIAILLSQLPGAATLPHKSETWRVLSGTVAAFLTLVFLVGGIGRAWVKAYNIDRLGPLMLPKISEYRWPDEVGAWLGDNLPEDSTVFVYDYPGALAYYSGLDILPMDGLVNDFDYGEDLDEIGVNAYLCAHNVDYFLGGLTSAHGEQEVDVLNPLSREVVGTLKLVQEDLVIKVGEIVTSPDSAPNLALWRIDRACATGN